MTLIRSSALLALSLAACVAVRHYEVEPARWSRAQVVPRGEELLSELNCLACHTADPVTRERLQPKTAPILTSVGARRTPQWMTRFLADPQGTQPGTTMPDMLRGLEKGERERAVRALVQFLASREGPLDITPRPGSADAVERGRLLFHSVGCVACHEPFEGADWLDESYWDLEARGVGEEGGDEEEEYPDDELYLPPGILPAPLVPLGDLASKTNIDALASFLMDPLAERPSGRMPSLGLDTSEAFDIAAYLPRAQAVGTKVVPGIAYEYFEDQVSTVDDIAGMTLVREGVADDLGSLPEHRGDFFAFRFSAFLEVPEEGEYTFMTWSDDGSRLLIDGKVVVDNDGHHAPTRRAGKARLTAGRHTLTATFFEYGGGEELEVTWEGPGVSERAIGVPFVAHQSLVFAPLNAEPFARDETLVEEGRTYFGSLGCASCHSLGEGFVDGGGMPLGELDAAASHGCIEGEERRGVPVFALTDEDRSALRQTLARKADLAVALEPDAEVQHTLSRFRCYSCHRRDEIGGPHPERMPYFAVIGDVDLGDQGRLPPHLEHVGMKLRRTWVEAVLLHGESQRPYMATRMPQFGVENVGALPRLFEELDGHAGDEPEARFDGELLEAGRKLVGTGGLGCIQCHTFAGHPSLGVPAVDLATVYEHTKPEWFEKLLLDPKSVQMNSRMPEFWEDGASPVKDVLDGDPARQAEAIWAYLSLGDSMLLPQGLVVEDGEYEIEIGERPRLVGVFMEGVSPRTIAVGTQDHVHYAFDVENSRLAMAWIGRFFNAEGTWRGRAGSLERPASMDRVDLPPGVPFARLETGVAWPEGSGREAGYRPLGRTFDQAGTPTWRYSMGGITVAETVTPHGRGFTRTLRLHAEEQPLDLKFRAAVGEIGRSESGGYIVDDHLTVRVHRHSVNTHENELRVSVPFEPGPDGFEAELVMEVSW